MKSLLLITLFLFSFINAELTHFDAKLTNTGGLLDSVAGGAGTSTAATITAAAETNNKASGTAFIMGTKLSF